MWLGMNSSRPTMSTLFFCSYCVADMGCKVRAIPLAVKVAQDLDAAGSIDEAG